MIKTLSNCIKCKYPYIIGCIAGIIWYLLFYITAKFYPEYLTAIFYYGSLIFCIFPGTISVYLFNKKVEKNSYTQAAIVGGIAGFMTVLSMQFAYLIMPYEIVCMIDSNYIDYSNYCSDVFFNLKEFIILIFVYLTLINAFGGMCELYEYLKFNKKSQQ